MRPSSCSLLGEEGGRGQDSPILAIVVNSCRMAMRIKQGKAVLVCECMSCQGADGCVVDDSSNSKKTVSYLVRRFVLHMIQTPTLNSSTWSNIAATLFGLVVQVDARTTHYSGGEQKEKEGRRFKSRRLHIEDEHVRDEGGGNLVAGYWIDERVEESFYGTITCLFWLSSEYC